MRWTTILISGLAATSFVVTAAAQNTGTTDSSLPANTFTVLTYHEVLDDVRDYPDPNAVDSTALVAQLAWLRGSGYTPVSLEEILIARQGGKPLPAKAILLSFDDAYLSFYTRVYPLLREFHYPAVLGVVGRWIDDPQSGAGMYGEKGTVPLASFPSWDQIREMASSGLIEIASHSYDLHHGVLANPQGNLQAAATSRIYDPATGSYEDDAGWRARVRADLAHSSQVIERETGRKPRVMVWPYGSYNEELVRIAGESGMTITFTLDDKINTPDMPLTAIPRTLIQHNPVLADFGYEVRGPLYPEPIRVVQVDLDQIYNVDPVLQEQNLSMLLDRILALMPSHVYLQATTDLDGDGIADAAYFPTRHLSVRSDLFNRVAWQIASRDKAKVFALLPVTEFHLPENSITEIYEDLARYTHFDGIVFDDKMLHDGIDNAGTPEFTHELALRMRAFRAPLITVRTMNIDSYAENAVQNVQSFTAFADAYDYIALTGVPIDENTAHPDTWLATLATRLGRIPTDPVSWRKFVFMLDLAQLGEAIQTQAGQSGQIIARQMRDLQLGNALNFGYYGGDFLRDDPRLAYIIPAMSKRVYPR